MSNNANQFWQVPGVYRTAAKDDVLDTLEVKSGTHVFASIVDADTDVSSLFFVIRRSSFLIKFRYLPLAPMQQQQILQGLLQSLV
jgi:hypothetical protein